MKILVVSDTHGKNENLFELLRKEKDIDYFVHCGDTDGLEDYIEEFAKCNIVMVRGNCDYCSPLPACDTFTVCGRKIFVTHGHLYSVKSGLNRLIDTARENGADIVLYGHSHIPDYSFHNGVYLVNPGSLSEPRQPGRRHTYAIINISIDGKIACNLHSME